MYDGFIYETTCTENEMKYRGQHKRSHIDPNDPDDSWYIGSPTNPQFWEDLEKYGRDTFVREIIQDGPFDSLEHISRTETRRLKEVDAANNPQYYNLSNWGGTEDQHGENNPMYGKVGPLHHGYGIPRPEDVKKKISENHADVSGEKNPMYGKEFSGEHRRKISEGRSIYWSGDNNPMHINPPSGEKNPMYGRKRITKDGKNLSVYGYELDTYLSRGWVLGMTRRKAEV